MKTKKEEVDKFLLKYAKEYHTKEFIKSDPIQFPHRYLRKQDIEISGFVTSFLSFGSRPLIIKAAESVDVLFSKAPLEYVKGEKWREDFIGNETFYRTISKGRMRELFEWLHMIYTTNESMEDAIQTLEGTPMERLCTLFGVTSNAPQKKVNMFLRWMIRKDSEVDFGIWKSFSQQDLLIPLDTHVSQIACQIGLTKSKSYSLSNARTITKELNIVFPGDPCLGDFALFGFGVNEQN
ncbi:hypothetical protein EIN_341630 [Entamoeba invadens IP1]|uniref:TIGR02757 family protein n=1 Tax=Entamoeba invadens IP1 TaxID=370355 RepID=A0A0A1UDT5_ENTIV|nr:hypothetical protein EIN_341630 [Entamoeba invadens IP1]ELP94765.1 hypothetical protein EIN_341630 [Entamoeba invadens IP1]|eukprot:XP_004261536.1 hypothetical protein EIN_341630 [Entamoeba invadens IP1]